MLLEREVAAVIFDLDDTLYPEIEFVYQGFATVAKLLSELGSADARRLFEDMKSLLALNGRGHVFDDVCSMHLIDARIEDLVQSYRGTQAHLKLYEDANRMLLLCKKLEVKTGLITDGNAKVQWNKICALELRERMDGIIVTDELQTSKPDAFVYQKCLDELSVSPQNAVYIGDNPAKDFIGAREIGMRTIRVVRSNTSYGASRAPRGFEADYSVRSFDEIVFANR